MARDGFRIPDSMIDVVFLLLIFFVVTARFRQNEERLKSELPRDEGMHHVVNKSHERPETVVIRVRRVTGGVEWRYGNRKTDSYETLVDTLYGLRRTMPDFAVEVDGSPDVPFKSVVAVLDACGRVGITNVKFRAPTSL